MLLGAEGNLSYDELCDIRLMSTAFWLGCGLCVSIGSGGFVL